MDTFLLEKSEVLQNFDKEALKFVHFKSVENFIIHFNNIRGEVNKTMIRKLLQDYFEVINNEPIITKEISQSLYLLFIEKIASFYIIELGFRRMPRLGDSIFIGGMLDLFLYFIGISQKIYFIPIVTIFLLYYFLDMSIRYKLKNKVYGYKF